MTNTKTKERPTRRSPRDPIKRSNLVRRVLEVKCRLILLTAPFGYGKSVLLEQIEQEAHAEPSIVPKRISMRAAQDPTTFLSALVNACSPGTADPQSADAPSIRQVIDTLSASREQRLLFLIDDYDPDVSPATNEALSAILRHELMHHQFVIGTRSLRLPGTSTLILQRQQLTLGPDELCFTRDDIEQSFRDTLDGDTIESLMVQSAGWPGAFGVVQGWLSEGTPEHAIRNRVAHLGQYTSPLFEDEVIAHFDPSVRSFLVEMSIVDRFDTALAREVCGEPVSRAILDHLRSANGFTRPEEDDPSWFRHHPLFRDALVKTRRTHHTQEDEAAAHERAGRFWYRQGHPDRALYHLARGNQPALVGEILDGITDIFVLEGIGDAEVEALQRFDHPRWTLIRALSQIKTHDHQSAAALLSQDTDQLPWTGLPNAEQLYHEHELLSAMANLHTADGAVQLPVDRLKRLATPGILGSVVGFGHVVHTLGRRFIIDGAFVEATRQIERAAHAFERVAATDELCQARLDLAMLALIDGNYEEASDYATRIAREIREQRNVNAGLIAASRLLQAICAIEYGMRSSGLRLLEESLRVAMEEDALFWPFRGHIVFYFLMSTIPEGDTWSIALNECLVDAAKSPRDEDRLVVEAIGRYAEIIRSEAQGSTTNTTALEKALSKPWPEPRTKDDKASSWFTATYQRLATIRGMLYAQHAGQSDANALPDALIAFRKDLPKQGAGWFVRKLGALQALGCSGLEQNEAIRAYLLTPDTERQCGTFLQEGRLAFKALSKASRGLRKTPLTMPIAQAYINHFYYVRDFIADIIAPAFADKLTSTHLDLLTASSAGASFDEMATRLNLSPTTVVSQMRSIYRRMGLDDKERFLAIAMYRRYLADRD